MKCSQIPEWSTQTDATCTPEFQVCLGLGRDRHKQFNSLMFRYLNLKASSNGLKRAKFMTAMLNLSRRAGMEAYLEFRQQGQGLNIHVKSTNIGGFPKYLPCLPTQIVLNSPQCFNMQH
jgi:hypothetical protein